MSSKRPLVKPRAPGCEGSTSNRHVADRFSLLDIPLEIRLRIYSHIFDDAVIELRRSDLRAYYHGDQPVASDRLPTAFKHVIGSKHVQAHIWRPRTQILGTCKQIRGEIFLFDIYSLEVNFNMGEDYRLEWRGRLSPFLWSNITVMSMNLNRNILRLWFDFEGVRPPRLRRYYFCNRPFSIKQEVAAASTADRFNGLWAEPYIGYGAEDLNAVKVGVKDLEVLTQVINNNRGLAQHIAKIGCTAGGNLSTEKSNYFCYIGVKVVVFPPSSRRPPPLYYSSGEFIARRYSQYPQLVRQRSNRDILAVDTHSV